MAKLEAGMLVRIVNANNPIKDAEFIGHEGIILKLSDVVRPDGMTRWEVDGVVDSNGAYFTIMAQFLRIINPPEEEINWVEKLGLKNLDKVTA